MLARSDSLPTAHCPGIGRRVLRFLLIACLVSPAVAQAALQIRGRVVDERGDPVPRAAVELSAYPIRAERCRELLAGREYPEPTARVETAADGRYLLEAPEPGMWQVNVRAPSRIPVRLVLFPLTTSQDLPDAELRADAGVRIEVVDPAGKPVGNAQVRARSIEDGLRRGRTSGWWERGFFGFTDADGRLELSRPKGAKVTVTAWAGGFLSSAETTITGGSGRVRLRAGTLAKFRFVEARDMPIADALVGVEGWNWIGGFTDGEGVVAVTLEPGKPLEYALQRSDGATHGGSIERSAADLELQGEVIETIVLSKPERLRERVVDARSREPIAGALVWSGRDQGHVVRSAQDGSYELLEFASGNLRIGSGAAGYQTNWGNVEGGQEEPRAPILALSPAASLDGRVVDAAGEGVGSVEVKAVSADSWRHPTVSSREDGSFRFEDLELDETYEIVANALGYAPTSTTVKLAPEATVELVLQRGRSLIGSVIDEAGAPVAGAEVKLLPVSTEFSGRFRDRGRGASASATTDAGGAFRIEGLGQDPMALLVRASGFAERLITGLEMEGEAPVVDAGEIALAAGVALRGVIRNRAGAAVESAQIRVESEAFARFLLVGRAAVEMGRSAVSGADGEFVIEDLARSDALRVGVDHDRYVRKELEGIRPGGDDRLEIVLDRAARVSGRVENEEGRAIGGATVIVSPLTAEDGLTSRRAQWSRLRDRTAMDGTFTITGLQAGRVEVRAEMKGYLAAEPVELTLSVGDERAGARLILRRGATLEGRVVDSGGEPILGARVRVEQEQTTLFRMPSGGRAEASTDADGRFSLEGLPAPPNAVVLHVEHADYVDFEERLELESGLEKLIVLDAGVTVSGFVLTEAGEPVGGADVQLTKSGRFAGGAAARSQSLEDGSFEIGGVPEGTYQVTASKTGFATSVAETPIEVRLAPVRGLTVYLEQGGVIRGSILGLERGERDQIQILVMSEDQRRPQNFGLVDPDGEYRVANVGIAKGTVIAASPVSGRQVQEPFELDTRGGEIRVDLEFPSGSGLSGEVRLNGEPWDGAYVLASGGPTGQGAARTGRDGRFEILGLADGRYRVSILDRGTEQHSEDIEISGDTEIVIDVRSVRISGRVTDAASGEPIESATVQADAESSSVSPFGGGAVNTSAAGEFELSLPAGRELKLRARADGYSEASKAIDTALGDQAGVVFELESGVALDFGARLWSGIEPTSVSAAVVGPDGERIFARYLRPIGGRFRTSSLPPGRWNLLAVTQGSAVVSVPVEVPGPSIDLVLPMESRIEVNLEAIPDAGGTGKLRLVSGTGEVLRVPAFDTVVSEWPVRGLRTVISSVPAGAWRVEFESDTGRVWQGSVTTLGGATAEARIE